MKSRVDSNAIEMMQPCTEREVTFVSTEFDSVIKKNNRMFNWIVRVLMLIILCLGCAYAAMLIIQSIQNYANPDSSIYSQTESSLVFPTILACPALGNGNLVFSSTSCSGSGTSCSVRTWPVGVSNAACVEFNYLGDQFAASNSAYFTPSAVITQANTSAFSYTGVEIFMYNAGSTPASENALRQDLTSTSFVVNSNSVSFVHLAKTKYINVAGTTTKTVYTFTQSSTSFVNPPVANKFELRLNYNQMITTISQEYVNKDWYYVAGAIGGAVSALFISVRMANLCRAFRNQRRATVLEKTMIANGYRLTP
eukprot:ANDGO_04069.mRNA.1 hypothetical protein